MSYTSDYRSWLPSGDQRDLTSILGAAAGCASVSVIQHKCCSPSGIHKPDVSIINARGVTIGQVTDVYAPAGQEVRVRSKTPYAIHVITQERDEDPLIFRYGKTNGLVTIIPLSINVNLATGEKTAQGKGTAFSPIIKRYWRLVEDKVY